MPGYISRYDDLDGEYEFNPYETASPGNAGHEPPLRRGPLRSHTQHARGSVLRGPHAPTRKDGESIGLDRADSSSGFGAGL